MFSKKPPQYLYKYRPFSVNTLRMFSDAEVYFASPASFNDPLDCSPTIEVDVDIPILEKVLFRLLSDTRSKEAAKAEISNHRYMASEDGDIRVPGPAMDYYKRRLSAAVQDALRKAFGKYGVLSLASKWDCPLMWSHYADQHLGMCLEFEMDESAECLPVDYTLSRQIRVSDLASWKIDGSTQAKDKVWNSFFLAKAPRWRYEREWRSVAETTGPQFVKGRLNAVHFGLRCDASLITTVVMLHAVDPKAVKFYGIQVREQGFRLVRKRINSEEILIGGVRTSPWLDFRDVVTDETNA